MRLSYFAKIVLRSTKNGGSAATLYVSTHGGHRNNGSSVVYFPPVLSLGAALVSEFGKAKDPYQVPARLLLTIKNKDNVYSDYLPGGASSQYWDRSEVTLYEGDASKDGDTLASMVIAFQGKIAPGTMSFGEDYIEFDCYDIRVESNQPISTEIWSQHADYGSGSGIVAPGQPIPVILGDWTTTSAKIPAFLLNVSGSVYTYAVCNHAAGTLTVYDADGNSLTPTSTANFATRGSFQMTGGSGGYAAGESVFVKCKGYPASLTDANHVRLIEFILTQFCGVDSSNIYNPIADSTNNERGSFRVLYDSSLGSAPEYPAHFYVSDASILALNAAALVAYECNAWLTVVDNQYRIYWETPQAAADLLTIPERYLSDAPMTTADPDDDFCTVIRASHDYDPASTSYLGNYDSSAQLTSGPIDTQRDVYRGVTTQTVTKEDVVLDDQYTSIYDATTAALSVKRRLFWRIRVPQIVNASFHDDRQDGDRLSLNLFNDIIIDRGQYSAKPLRVLSLAKNQQTGVITMRGLSLSNIPQIGQWTDDDGLDLLGNQVESYWGDSDGIGNDLNLVGVWY